MKVLVFGSGGQLGGATVRQLAARHDVVGRSRADVDVTSSAAVHAAVAAARPDVIINCAAYNQVDQAEDMPIQALSTNAWAVRFMAREAAATGAILVHYGTDFVFDGSSIQPYVEDDAPNPRSTYAVSKLLGEWFAADAPRHYVLRVESLFGGSRTSSIDRFLSGVLKGEEVRAFTDRTVSPSYVDDVIEATRALIEDAHPFGLYHCVNTGWATWLDVAREIAVLAGRPDARIIGTQMGALGLKAKRPQFAALSNAKLADIGIAMPTWQDALSRYVRNCL